MKILIFLFLTFNISAQVIYNPIDTTYTFTYAHLQSIKNNIESCKAQRGALEREIIILEDIRATQDQKIKKLVIRDSLYQKELGLYKEMDYIMRDKLYRANDIMNNYKILLVGTEDQLRIESKKARKERMWKQIYKWSYPAAALIVTGIIITK